MDWKYKYKIWKFENSYCPKPCLGQGSSIQSINIVSLYLQIPKGHHLVIYFIKSEEYTSSLNIKKDHKRGD